jgi:hypothetical protein
MTELNSSLQGQPLTKAKDIHALFNKERKTHDGLVDEEEEA